MMTNDEIIAVVTAAKEGKTIQSRSYAFGPGPHWKLVEKPDWNFSDCEFRVAPKPREWWLVMLKTTGDCSCAMPSKEIAKNYAAGSARGPFEIVHVREVLE